MVRNLRWPTHDIDEGRVILVGVELDEVIADSLVDQGYAENIVEQSPETANAKHAGAERAVQRSPRRTTKEER